MMSAFVDESYGDDGRLLLAGLIASWDSWAGFNIEWKRLLQNAGVPYAHYLEMDRNKGPFGRDVWNVARKAAFLRVQREIADRWVQLGITVSVDLRLYGEVYRPDFPKRASPDSAYGIAGKELILSVQRHCAELFAGVQTINFAWETGHANLPNVAAIFQSLKDCYGEKAATLGSFISLSRTDAPALQAVDQLSVAARTAEVKAKAESRFASVPEGSSLGDIGALLAPGETYPVFYHELDEARLLWHREHAKEMATLRRRTR